MKLDWILQTAKTRSLCLLMSCMLLASFLLAPLHANAQSSTGQILGTVTDSTGSVVPGAAVTVTNTATNVARTVKSSAAGDYLVEQLIPGPYTIKVEAPGFATTVVTVGALQVNQALDQIISLKPGAETQVVQVNATGEIMQTATSEVGVVIDPDQVHDIPLNGRNFTQLITLAPGAGASGHEPVGAHRFRSYIVSWSSGQQPGATRSPGPVEQDELLHPGWRYQ